MRQILLTRLNNPTLVFAAFAVVCAALWIPWVAYLMSPERTDALGYRGRVFLNISFVVQLLSACLPFIIELVARNRFAIENMLTSLTLGVIAIPAAVVWAYWFSFALIDIGFAELVVFGLICAVLLIPTLIPPRWAAVREHTGQVTVAALLAATILLVATGSAVMLIAPLAMYGGATLTSGVTARYARQA